MTTKGTPASPDPADPESIDLGPIVDQVIPSPVEGGVRRERTRERLAYGIGLLLAAVVLAPLYVLVVQHREWAEIEGAVSGIYPGLLGVTGTVLGFYFGSEKRGGR